LLGGEITYVLSTAGHIQSLINPPGNPKRKFFSNPETPPDCEQWLAQAEEHPGSWWPHWVEWQRNINAETKAAPTTFGDSDHPELAAAPGTYVHE
jgi:polyhydroxyalkanoate synthase